MSEIRLDKCYDKIVHDKFADMMAEFLENSRKGGGGNEFRFPKLVWFEELDMFKPTPPKDADEEYGIIASEVFKTRIGWVLK